MARYATARYSVKEVREATWARRVALFFVQLLILTVLLHRFASLTTPAAINLIAVCIAGLFLAIAIPIAEPDAAAVEAQEEAYPDIGPMALERSAPEVFSLVHEAVERLGWTIALNEAPGETGIGRIEATDRTLVMGFTDDVLVQIKGDDAHAIIDARSVSRYGWHDLGTNAARIRALLAEVTAALEKGEKTVLEQAVPKVESPEKKNVTKKRAKKRGGKKRSTNRP